MKHQNHTTRKVTREDQALGLFRRFSPRLLRVVIPTSLLLVGLGIFAARGVHSDPGKTTAKASPDFSDAVATKSNHSRSGHAKSHQWNWPTDGRCTYQIKQSLDLAAGDSSMTPDACGRTEIEGKLNVCFLDADAEGITLAMQLSDVAVTVDPAGEKTADRQPVIEKMLNSSPGLLHLDRDGRVLSCELPAALANEDRGMLQGLFANEIVLGNGDRWEADEKVQGLPCRSLYRTETGAKISKTRRALDAPKGQPSLRILKSGFIAVPGPFWLESLDGAEQLEYVWQDRVICGANISVKLSRLKETAIPESLVSLMMDPVKQDALIDSASLTSTDEATQKSALERQKMARLVEKYQAVPANRMVEDLLKAVSAGTGHEATIPAIHALRDWLLANPARSSEIAEALKKPELKGPMAARMAHALELAGRTSMESQVALASILSAPPGTFDPSVIMQAAAAAGGVGQLQNPDLIAALIHMASAENPSADFRLSDAALYALGALAKDNPALEQSIVNAYSPMLVTDGSVPAVDTATTLRAFANAQTQNVGIMEKALTISTNHPDPEARLAAIDFFTSNGTPEAIAAIKRMLNDNSENVRKQASAALASPELAQSTASAK